MDAQDHSHGLTRAEVRKWVRASCKAQGKPSKVKDPAQLARVLAILNTAENMTDAES